MDLPPHYKDSLATEVGEGTYGGSRAGSSEPHPGSDGLFPTSPVVMWICLNIKLLEIRWKIERSVDTTVSY